MTDRVVAGLAGLAMAFGATVELVADRLVGGVEDRSSTSEASTAHVEVPIQDAHHEHDQELVLAAVEVPQGMEAAGEIAGSVRLAELMAALDRDLGAVRHEVAKQEATGLVELVVGIAQSLDYAVAERTLRVTRRQSVLLKVDGVPEPQDQGLYLGYSVPLDRVRVIEGTTYQSDGRTWQAAQDVDGRLVPAVVLLCDADEPCIVSQGGHPAAPWRPSRSAHIDCAAELCPAAAGRLEELVAIARGMVTR